MKILSLVLTAVLLTMALAFVFKFTQTCYECNGPSQPHTMTYNLTRPELMLAGINFLFAVISVYLIARKNYTINTIVSGMVVGLQVVFFGMIFLLAQ